jgi:hypothetical protein
MTRPEKGFHCRLKASTLALVRQQYPWATADQLWRVDVVDGGYGRDALHLVEEGAAEPRRVVVWRGQVVAEPRCVMCGVEGHTESTATAKNCRSQAEYVATKREEQAARMREHWARVKAEAAEMRGAAPAAEPPGPEAA